LYFLRKYSPVPIENLCLCTKMAVN
jgi:hypothetical protein